PGCRRARQRVRAPPHLLEQQIAGEPAQRRPFLLAFPSRSVSPRRQPAGDKPLEQPPTGLQIGDREDIGSQPLTSSSSGATKMTDDMGKTAFVQRTLEPGRLVRTRHGSLPLRGDTYECEQIVADCPATWNPPGGAEHQPPQGTALATVEA